MTNNISEEASVELSHLRWHCRRGVKELDVVLRNYLDNHYLSSPLHTQKAFKELLELEDPILMSLVMDQHQSQDDSQNQVLAVIKKPFAK